MKQLPLYFLSLLFLILAPSSFAKYERLPRNPSANTCMEGNAAQCTDATGVTDSRAQPAKRSVYN